jgi:hypothetical protein
MNNTMRMAVMLGLFLVTLGCVQPQQPGVSPGVSPGTPAGQSTWLFAMTSPAGPDYVGSMTVTETPNGPDEYAISGAVETSNSPCLSGGYNISGVVDTGPTSNTLALEFLNYDGVEVLSVVTNVNSAFSSMTAGSYQAEQGCPSSQAPIGTWTATTQP